MDFMISWFLKPVDGYRRKRRLLLLRNAKPLTSDKLPGVQVGCIVIIRVVTRRYEVMPPKMQRRLFNNDLRVWYVEKVYPDCIGIRNKRSGSIAYIGDMGIRLSDGNRLSIYSCRRGREHLLKLYVRFPKWHDLLFTRTTSVTWNG